jgi:hypothetical protein
MCPEWRLTPAAASLFIFIFIFAQFKTHGCALSSVNASICNDLTSQMDDLTEVFAERELGGGGGGGGRREREREREREQTHTHTHTAL